MIGQSDISNTRLRAASASSKLLKLYFTIM